jgi:Family of unknown function (DUF6152)
MRNGIGIHAQAIFVAAGLSMAGSPLFAHHGWSGYDASRTMELKGKILDSGYEHPHGFVRLQAESKTWLVVLAPPSRMERRNLPRKLLAPGTEATVVGYPSRTDSMEIRAERIRIGDRTTELR